MYRVSRKDNGMKKLATLVLAAAFSITAAFGSLAATEIGLNLDWKYAANSKINTGKAVLFTTDAEKPKNITVAVNAGHGTKGGSSVKTLVHPDGSAKLTGGTTKAGVTQAVAVSGGMNFADGRSEASVNLELAHILGKQLLSEGYDVLMIRQESDVQLDNIARTVIANNKADCHIALHFDSTSKDKGAFYMSVPDGLKSMEPVASNWKKHERLGESLISGLRENEVKIFSAGSMDMDLTQTSYSTIPSVDIELGDKNTDHGTASLEKFARGLTAGVNLYYGY